MRFAPFLAFLFVLLVANPSISALRSFAVHPGWGKPKFPEHAACYKTPEELKKMHPSIASYEKPEDGALRIVGTGHSFMAPGYKTFPHIARASGFAEQPLYTHTGGGMTGSTRYKWEQENGIFQFEGKPKPKLLASIANAKWDAMMWGPYFNDRPQYYSCWVDFCLKYNPDMKFYLSDAWPSIMQMKKYPKSEEELTTELFARLGKERHDKYADLLEELRDKYPGKIFIMPTSDAMVLSVKYFHEGKLPGVEAIHRAISGKAHCLWNDPLGHLGRGFDRLEGYVFYATIYGKSPELIKEDIKFNERGGGDFPSPELDKMFRKIAWEAVTGNPLSGVTDKDGDGIGEKAEQK